MSEDLYRKVEKYGCEVYEKVKPEKPGISKVRIFDKEDTKK